MIPIITAVAGVLSALASISTLGHNSTAASSASSPSDDAGAPVAAFSDALKSALDRVNDSVATADVKAKAFASGDQSVSLSDVMVSLEQANLALQAAAAVRDKVIAAYTNIMNMPV